MSTLWRSVSYVTLLPFHMLDFNKQHFVSTGNCAVVPYVPLSPSTNTDCKLGENEH